MAQHITGNTRGLPPSQIKRIERLYSRKLDSEDLISSEFARELFEVAHDLRRRIGVLISREGRIEEVFVGTKDLLYLPDLGRYRLGTGRLRRLRLVFSDLSNQEEKAQIPPDIYGDLEKLRLDCVVSVKHSRNRMLASFAHLMPLGASEPVQTDLINDLGKLKLDFDAFIEELENELESDVGENLSQKGAAVLVGVYDKTQSEAESSMLELRELARTAGLTVIESVIQRKAPDPKTLLGKGKLEEVVLSCLRKGAEMLVFDCELRPSQWRIITNSTELKVIDRSMLILDIFSQRATSSEGRLQVELAQLKYNLPRLVEKDVGLSRLTGGIGGRGPGETKLEIGRRRSRERITLLEGKIQELSKQRGVRRSRRKVNDIPLVAIVGYTNVGKSTLFNALTGSKVVAENKLFATLDPAQRRLFIPSVSQEGIGREVIISDTVGFIRDLPAELVTAFKATLEELNEATLLIHVIDASDVEIAMRKASVEAILKEMGLLSVRTLVLLNKIDLVSDSRVDELCREFEAIPVSAEKRIGFQDIVGTIASILSLPAPNPVPGISL